MAPQLLQSPSPALNFERYPGALAAELHLDYLRKQRAEIQRVRDALRTERDRVQAHLDTLRSADYGYEILEEGEDELQRLDDDLDRAEQEHAELDARYTEAERCDLYGERLPPRETR